MPDRINFTQQINDSAQVGDILFFSTVNGFTNQTTSVPSQIGPITAIGENFIEVDTGSAPANFTQAEIEANQVANANFGAPLFMFRKDGNSNISTLVGYFAEITLTETGDNFSNKELFGIGSEIFVSSK
jgi:hypothetical protein